MVIVVTVAMPYYFRSFVLNLEVIHLTFSNTIETIKSKHLITHTTAFKHFSVSISSASYSKAYFSFDFTSISLAYSIRFTSKMKACSNLAHY